MQAVAAKIATQLSPDRVWRITIAPHKSRRSPDQNNRAWALYRAIADETGYTAGEVHELCKVKFGEPKTIEIGGVMIEQYSTRDKDVVWMADYMTRIEAWAASELGVMLG